MKLKNSNIECNEIGIQIITLLNYLIEKCTIKNNSSGIKSEAIGVSGIIACTIHGNKEFGLLNHSDNLNIIQNIFSDNGKGVVTYRRCVIHNNQIFENNLFGIGVIGDDINIKDNLFKSNSTGVVIEGNHNFLSGNTFNDNKHGVKINGNYNKILGDYFNDGETGIQIMGTGKDNILMNISLFFIRGIPIIDDGQKTICTDSSIKLIQS